MRTTTRNVFDGGKCTTLDVDPSLVMMRNPETNKLCFMKFIGNGKGWVVARNLTEKELIDEGEDL